MVYHIHPLTCPIDALLTITGQHKPRRWAEDRSAMSSTGMRYPRCVILQRGSWQLELKFRQTVSKRTITKRRDVRSKYVAPSPCIPALGIDMVRLMPCTHVAIFSTKRMEMTPQRSAVQRRIF